MADKPQAASTGGIAPEPRTYTAFISYRHADNFEMGRKWANWLHESLEAYEVPEDIAGTTNLRGEPVPAALYPVFRDELELPADADLGNNIRHALDHSGLLVVLCSPRAVASRFVADEIRYFKEIGKADRIIAMVLDGEPNASDDPARAALECFPEPLRYGVTGADGITDWRLRAEPIAADVRPAGRPEQGWTSAGAYRQQLEERGGLSSKEILDASREYGERLDLAKMKVIAGALGVALGTLTRRDKAFQLAKARQRAKVLRRWLAGVIALAVAAAIAGVLAWHQKGIADRQTVEARRQEQIAKEQTRTAEKRELLLNEESGRTSLLQREPRKASTFLERAVEIAQKTGDDSRAARLLLGQARIPQAGVLADFNALDSMPLDCVISPDGRRIFLMASNQARVWSDRGEFLAEVRNSRYSLHIYGQTRQGMDAELKRGLRITGDMLQVYDTTHGGAPTVIPVDTGFAAISLDGKRVAVIPNSYPKVASMWNSRSGEKLFEIPTGPEESGADWCLFSADGNHLLLCHGFQMRIVDSSDGTVLSSVDLENIEPKVVVAGAGPAFCIRDRGSLLLWNGREFKKIPVDFEREAESKTVFSPDGRILVVGLEKEIRLFGMEGELLKSFEAVGKILQERHFSRDSKSLLIQLLSEETDALALLDLETWKSRPVAVFNKFDLGSMDCGSGERIAAAGSRELIILGMPGAQVLKKIPVERSSLTPLTLRFVNDLDTILTGEGDGRIEIRDWREVRSEALLAVPGGNHSQSSLSPDGKKVLQFSKLGGWRQGAPRMVNLTNGQATELAGLEENWLLSAEFGPDDKKMLTVASVLPGQKQELVFSVWNTRTGNKVETGYPPESASLIGFGGSPTAVLLQDGIVCTLLENPEKENPVRIGKTLSSLREIASIPGIKKILPAPDGDSFAIFHGENKVAFYDSRDGREMARQVDATNAFFSPSSDAVLVLRPNGEAEVFDYPSLKNSRLLRGERFRGFPRVAAFDAGARLVATAGDDEELLLWDAGKGERLALLARPLVRKASDPGEKSYLLPSFGGSEGIPERSITSLVFSPDGAFLATGGGVAHGINLWDTAGRRHLFRLPTSGNAVTSMAYQPGGERLTVAEGATVRVLDVSLAPIPK